MLACNNNQMERWRDERMKKWNRVRESRERTEVSERCVWVSIVPSTVSAISTYNKICLAHWSTGYHHSPLLRAPLHRFPSLFPLSTTSCRVLSLIGHVIHIDGHDDPDVSSYKEIDRRVGLEPSKAHGQHGSMHLQVLLARCLLQPVDSLAKQDKFQNNMTCS